MLVLALLACVAPGRVPSGVANPETCNPRPLGPGEARARRIPCGDELIVGGEGRVGDWLIENARARFVVRGPYAALTVLDADGGTIVDAAAPGGEDLLLEYVPDGDRSSVRAETDADGARLVLPGLAYRLGPDDDALAIEGSDAGTLQGRPEIVRTGATLGRDGEGFFGLDGVAEGEGARVRVEGVTQAALSAAPLFPEGATLRADLDADAVVVRDGARALYRARVVAGAVEVRAPAGAGLEGEREGCAYAGATLRGCGWLTLRVADGDGADLRALVTDGRGTVHAVPEGGGRVPVGPDPFVGWVWAGPRHAAVPLALPGGDAARTVALRREVWRDDALLAAPGVEVAPDADATVPPATALGRLAGEGVRFALIVADDEVPTATADPHDGMVTAAGSRAGGLAWAWPWTASTRKPGHGAVAASGLGALDLLAVIEGGQSLARRTVVTTAWVAAARAEAAPGDWDPVPDALWLDSLDDLEVYTGLLDDWVDLAAAGPRTWIDAAADDNLVAYERGIVEGRTCAGNGPRVALAVLDPPGGSARPRVRVTVEAPRWMGLHTLVVRTDRGEDARAIEGAGSWGIALPAGARWAVAHVEGRRARPGEDAPAWAVSGPAWLAGP